MISKVLFKNVQLFTGNAPQFAIRTSQVSILSYRGEDGKKVHFTREMLRKKAELQEQGRAQQILDIQKKRSEQALKAQILSIPANEKNPENIVKVKINQTLETNPNSLQSPFLLQKIEKINNLASPFVIIKNPRPEQILVTGIRRNVDTSLKRMRESVALVKGQHLFDALSLTENLHTQGGRYMHSALKQVMDHAKNKNLIRDRLYVNSIIVGKQRRFRQIRYHAQGSSGRAKHDICQLRITLEQRPIKDMYKQVVSGNTPPILAYLLREQLLNENANLQTLQQYSFITTSRGRQQRRLMLKRKSLLQYREFKAQGINVPIKIIQQKLVEQQALKWSADYQKNIIQNNNTKINKRTELFKKNEESNKI